jgi:site-specific recombinase XerD
MQKHSVKLLLKKNKINELGQMPIYLRVTVNRKTSFTSTGYSIPPKMWDANLELVKEAHKLHAQINLDITNKKKEVLQELINASVKGKGLSAKGVKDLHAGKLHDIYQFAEQFKRQVKNNKSRSTLTNYDKHLRKLKEYAGELLSFEEITVDFLTNFDEWMQDPKNVKTRQGTDNKGNYRNLIFRTIRTLFNAARKKGIIEVYPFSQFEMPKTTGGNKAYLTFKEVIKWHEYTVETDHATLKQSALYFLFACYTGLRLSDWKEFVEAKIKERNISLRAAKNKVWVNVPLHIRLLEVLKMMKETKLYLSEPTINAHLKKIAGYLKIDKKLTTHCGRKTFAVTMCLERGVSSETAAKLMGITLAVFEKNYSYITPEKIRLETDKAWKDL